MLLCCDIRLVGAEQLSIRRCSSTTGDVHYSAAMGGQADHRNDTPAGHCAILLLLTQHAGANKISPCIGKASGVLAAPIMPTLVRELLTALQLPFEQLRVIPHGAGPPFRTCRKGPAVLGESRRWSARAKHRYQEQ